MADDTKAPGVSDEIKAVIQATVRETIKALSPPGAKREPPPPLVPSTPIHASPKRSKTGSLEHRTLTDDELATAKSADHCVFVRTGAKEGVSVVQGGALHGKTLAAFDTLADAMDWHEKHGLTLRVQPQA